MTGNKAAGVRARKSLQDLKLLAQELRITIQRCKTETMQPRAFGEGQMFQTNFTTEGLAQDAFMSSSASAIMTAPSPSLAMSTSAPATVIMSQPIFHPALIPMSTTPMPTMVESNITTFHDGTCSLPPTSHSAM